MLPTWVPGIETKPAPGDLLLFQAFINTFEPDTSIDLLAEPASGNAWLHESGLVPVGIHFDDKTLARARGTREALRSLLDHNAGHGDTSASELQLLSDAANGSVFRLVVSDDDAHRVTAEPSGTDPLGRAVLRLMLIVRDAQLAGSWQRLKTCGNPECRWAYYDRSHSHKGRWCDMATCGNRVKNRALRARQADLPGDAT